MVLCFDRVSDKVVCSCSQSVIVLCFDLLSDVLVCCCSQSACLFCVLTWLDIRLFFVAHKVHVWIVV